MPFINKMNKSVLFIHVPKTGGTSVEKFLSDNGSLYLFNEKITAPFTVTPQHFTIQDVDYLFPGYEWSYIFAIVRDPYSRVESEYFYMKQIFKTLGRELSEFDTWLNESLDKVEICSNYSDNHFLKQSDFVNEKVKVFKFEYGISQILDNVSSDCKLQLDQGIQHLKKGKSKGELYWNPITRLRFNSFYEEDFVKFGYEMVIKKKSFFDFLKKGGTNC